ncbi:endolytic transglycosylase MltG [Nitratifractor sp.]
MRDRRLLFFVLFLLFIVTWVFWYHGSRRRTVMPTQKATLSQEKKSVTGSRRKFHPPIIPASSRTNPSPAELRELDRTGTLPALVYIPSGTKSEIFASFRYQGLPLWLSDYYTLSPDKIKPGWIRLTHPISLKEFFSKIDEFPRERTRRIVMYSGDSLDDFARQFSRQTRLPVRTIFEEYFRFSPYIDGGILAGYYRLPYRLSASPALAYLTERSEKEFAKLAKRYLGSYDPATFKRYLIVASIIQKETWHPEEMGRIASVIYNRLRRGMKLQIDATLNYGPWSHKAVTPQRIRTDTSRFNTYRYRGLPPEPLGSVTLDALRAALHPAESDDLYFVKNIYGTHDFAATYAGHLANISRIKAERAHLKRQKELWKDLERNEKR